VFCSLNLLIGGLLLSVSIVNYAPPKYDESVEKITESCSLNFYFWLFCQVYPDTVPRFLFWVSVFSGMQVLRTPLNETQANSSLVGILMTIGDVTDYL